MNGSRIIEILYASIVPSNAVFVCKIYMHAMDTGEAAVPC